MCIPLVGVVVSRDGNLAQVNLIGGEQVSVEASLYPDVAFEQHVLIDRGVIIEVIDAAEAQSLIQFYAELDNLWTEEDARHAE